MSEPDSIYEKTYRSYLGQIAELDFEYIAPLLGGVFVNGAIELKFFNKKYRISSEGVFNERGERAAFSEAVVLSKYLLMCPKEASQYQEWVGYNSFKDAAPFAAAFVTNVEKPLAEKFRGQTELLYKVTSETFGTPFDIGANYNLIMKFDILPKVPLLLLFNDEDEEFPSEALIRFEDIAQAYLDMECLAIIGWLLSDMLLEKAGLKNKPLM